MSNFFFALFDPTGGHDKRLALKRGIRQDLAASPSDHSILCVINAAHELMNDASDDERATNE